LSALSHTFCGGDPGKNIEAGAEKNQQLRKEIFYIFLTGQFQIVPQKSPVPQMPLALISAGAENFHPATPLRQTFFSEPLLADNAI